MTKRGIHTLSPKAVSAPEAAAMLSVSRWTMDRLIREKKVQAFKIGRVYRVTMASIDDLIKNKEQQEV